MRTRGKAIGRDICKKHEGSEEFKNVLRTLLTPKKEEEVADDEDDIQSSKESRKESRQVRKEYQKESGEQILSWLGRWCGRGANVLEGGHKSAKQIVPLTKESGISRYTASALGDVNPMDTPLVHCATEVSFQRSFSMSP